MKIRLEINNKPFKETILFNVLYIVLLVVRVLLAITLFGIPIILSLIIFTALGVKNTGDKMINLLESVSFEGDKS